MIRERGSVKGTCGCIYICNSWFQKKERWEEAGKRRKRRDRVMWGGTAGVGGRKQKVKFETNPV